MPRISPAKPTSPKKIVLASSTVSRLLDAIAATMPKSTAGSSTCTPPATLTKISWSKSLAPIFFSSTATSSATRSEEHTSELQSRRDLVCRLLLEKKKKKKKKQLNETYTKLRL